MKKLNIKKMDMKNALIYASNHKVILYPSTPNICNNLVGYLNYWNHKYVIVHDLKDYFERLNQEQCFDRYKVVICQDISENKIKFVNSYIKINYEIIEIIPESEPTPISTDKCSLPEIPPINKNKIKTSIVNFGDKKITLYSDNKSIVVAEYNGQRSCANCNFDDDFDFKIMSEIAIERLLDKVNNYKIKKGDIVEIRQLKEILKSKTTGLQGIVSGFSIPDTLLVIQFPNGDYWEYRPEDLRVIHKS